MRCRRYERARPECKGLAATHATSSGRERGASDAAVTRAAVAPQVRGKQANFRVAPYPKRADTWKSTDFLLGETMKWFEKLTLGGVDLNAEQAAERVSLQEIALGSRANERCAENDEIRAIEGDSTSIRWAAVADILFEQRDDPNSHDVRRDAE